MKIDLAIAAMKCGQKVKLPEWGGYWFMPQPSDAATPDEGLIRVFTKNGDILDSAWVEKYHLRDDWEVTEGKMGFDFAILALKNHKEVCRKSWSGDGMFLCLIKGTPPQGDLPNGTIYSRTAENTLVAEWKPTTADMLSEDWELYTKAK